MTECVYTRDKKCAWCHRACLLLQRVIASQCEKDRPPSLERKLSVEEHVANADAGPAEEPEVFWYRCESTRKKVCCNKWRQLEEEFAGSGKFTCRKAETTCSDPCDECELSVHFEKNVFCLAPPYQVASLY